MHMQAKADAKREYGSAVPRDGSLLHHLLRAHNKETGRPFSELEIMAQGNTFLLAGVFFFYLGFFSVVFPFPCSARRL